MLILKLLNSIIKTHLLLFLISIFVFYIGNQIYYEFSTLVNDYSDNTNNIMSRRKQKLFMKGSNEITRRNSDSYFNYNS